MGTDYGDGVRGFADWINARGGIEGRPIDLIYQDYGYQVDRAEQLYTQFVGEGAVIFMGWGTGDTEALRLRIAEDEIPFSSASLSHRLGDPRRLPTTSCWRRPTATSFASPSTGSPATTARDTHRGADAQRESLRAVAGAAGRVAFAEAQGIDLTLYEMPRGAVDFTAEFSRIRQSGAQYVVSRTPRGRQRWLSRTRGVWGWTSPSSVSTGVRTPR